MTLAPWLFADENLQHARFVENYPMHLTANIDAVEACPGERRTNMPDMSLGIQLTHDWLLESGSISEQKYEELEAIRLNRKNARQRLLSSGQREQHTGDSGCTYSLSWTVEESSHSVQVIAYF